MIRAPGLTMQSHKETAMAEINSSVDRAAECYHVLALLDGVRAIVSELNDHEPEPDTFLNVERLLGDAIGRLKEVAMSEAALAGDEAAARSV
jgi:hypothetical protein